MDVEEGTFESAGLILESLELKKRVLSDMIKTLKFYDHDNDSSSPSEDEDATFPPSHVN